LATAVFAARPKSISAISPRPRQPTRRSRHLIPPTAPAQIKQRHQPKTPATHPSLATLYPANGPGQRNLRRPAQINQRHQPKTPATNQALAPDYLRG